MSYVYVSVSYNDRSYGGSITPARVTVSGSDSVVRVSVKGHGFSNSATINSYGGDIFGGSLTLPKELVKEVAIAMLALSEQLINRWEKDFPEEIQRLHRERVRDMRARFPELSNEDVEKRVNERESKLYSA